MLYVFVDSSSYTLILQTMATLGAPPPAATSLAFFPGDNNIIVIGFEDASIQIYNVRLDEVFACTDTRVLWVQNVLTSTC